MRTKTHRIKLTLDERGELEAVVKSSKVSFEKRRRAKVLLLCDESEYGPGWKDAQVATAENISVRQIQTLRQRCCEAGPLGTLERKQRQSPPNPLKITGEVEARITQLACSEAPQGRSRWTLQLLADKAVELEIIDSISDESVRSILKKVNSSLGNKNAGAFLQKKMPLL